MNLKEVPRQLFLSNVEESVKEDTTKLVRPKETSKLRETKNRRSFRNFKRLTVYDVKDQTLPPEYTYISKIQRQ